MQNLTYIAHICLLFSFIFLFIKNCVEFSWKRAEGDEKARKYAGKNNNGSKKIGNEKKNTKQP